ncbi:MAG: porin family protein [Hyphomicrobiales bacterium]|nr:porin family protein [Hyphomicrobiales bacterium]
MLKLAAHVTALSLALAGSAAAADLRRPAPVPAAPVVVGYSWTGCYLGAGGGYGMFNQETQFIDGASGGPLGLSSDNGGRGWFGTVQVGCDYQIGSTFVIGAFGDYDFSGIKGDMAVAVMPGIGEEKLKSSWAVGGRIGWLPFPQLLAFVSGGYTEARFGQVDFFSATTGTSFNLAMSKHTYSGWFLGSGYEYGIGWMPGLFWKTEYRFADYGSERVPLFSTISGIPTGDSIDAHKRVHTVRTEIVWRFNFGGPVTARY